MHPLVRVLGQDPCVDCQAAFTLAVRPPPWAGEAAIGYLVRVARANGFVSPRQLWQAVRGANPCTSAFDGLLNMVGGFPEYRALLAGPIPTYWNSKPLLERGLTGTDYNHSVMRWCADCLEESPYLRATWGVKLLCACVKHRRMLSDHCPNCGRTQRFERIDVLRCTCGARLTAVERIDASSIVCELCEYLLNGSERCRIEAFRGLGVDAWHRLVRYLGRFWTELEPKRPGQIAGLHRLDMASHLVDGAAHLLADWPEQFYVMLSTIRDRREGTRSICRSFGPVYRVLYHDLHASHFQFLREAFESYLNINWWGLVCGRNRSFQQETVAGHPRLTLANAARKAGTSLSILKHLVQVDLVPVSQYAMPSGRFARSVHGADVPRIAKMTKGALTLAETARLLGVQRHRVRELVDASFIVPLVSRRISNAASWLFDAVQLREYCVFSAASERGGTAIPLKQILKSWRLREAEFAEMVKAIAAKELVPVATGRTYLGDLLLDTREVRTWLKIHRMATDDAVSIEQAAGALRVKREVLCGLIDRGYLAAHVGATGARLIRNVDIQAFNEAYVPLVFVARARGTSPRAMLKELWVRPVCGPSVDGLRQYFLRRSDLRALLPGNK